jgi:hypothetical protein
MKYFLILLLLTSCKTLKPKTSMIIKISKVERNALEKGCALADLKVSFYSNETAEGLLTAEITDAFGEEVDRSMVWYLARQIDAQLQVEEFVNRK